MTPEERLTRQGWRRRATYDDPRLSEMVAAYVAIGLEVYLEPFRAENEPGCTTCLQENSDSFKTIYTRRIKR
jgi:hypothetical protein